MYIKLEFFKNQRNSVTLVLLVVVGIQVHRRPATYPTGLIIAPELVEGLSVNLPALTVQINWSIDIKLLQIVYLLSLEGLFTNLYTE